MLKKIKAGMELMEAGKRLKDESAVKWKKGQVSVGVLQAFFGAILVALYAFTGIEITIGEDALNSIATGLIAIVPIVIGLYNAVCTVITTNKIGLKVKPK